MAGFERGDYVRLSDIHREIREKFNYIDDVEKNAMIARWAGAPTLKNVARSGVTKLTEDSGEFTLVGLDKARLLGFHTRFVVCYRETGKGHAVCEVASPDYEEAYIFDSAQLKIVSRNDLDKYRFISVSPWDLEPNDSRPWLKVMKK
jgi:hypothetical protein